MNVGGMTAINTEQPYWLNRAQFHLRRQAAEDSLLEFIKQSWKLIQPGPLNINWHIECICDHLQAVANGESLRLLINLPPRHMKSLLVNVFFPAWVWAHDAGKNADGTMRAIQEHRWLGPGVKFMHITYLQDLTTRDSTRCRRLIESDWYQENWGHRFTLLSDQNQKTRFENDKGGYRFSGTMTSVTGWGGNIAVYDDPHDVLQVESKVPREEVIRFWSEQLQNRLDPERPGAIVAVMQRTHARDLSGYIIANEFGADLCDISNIREWSPYPWRHICLPARFERDHPHPMRTDVFRGRSTEVWKDKRQEGEALWPSLIPLEELDRRTASMTEYAIAGQFQQRPTAREGGLFKREWFEGKFIESIDIPEGTKYWRHWDLAASTGLTADWTCGVKLAKMPGKGFAVVDVIRVRKEAHDVRTLIKATAEQDGRHCGISLPQDTGQAGKGQARDLANMLAGWNVWTERETGDKVTRAEPVAAAAHNGILCIKRATWNDAFLEELCMFPGGAHDDQVDALSGAFLRFTMQRGEFSLGTYGPGNN